MNFNQQQYHPIIPRLWCVDSDDAEGWLVEEGIGYFDSSGTFHYGIDPNEIDDVDDIPSLSEFDEPPYVPDPNDEIDGDPPSDVDDMP